MKLYELPDAFSEIEALIEELDGELPGDLEDRLNSLEVTLGEKIDAICVKMSENLAEVAFYKAEIDRLAARKRAVERRVDWYKGYIRRTLETLGRDHAVGKLFKVRIQKNGVPKIRWTGTPDSIPEGFRKETVEVDQAAVMEAWKSGSLPDGFDVEVGSHLRIS